MKKVFLIPIYALFSSCCCAQTIQSTSGTGNTIDTILINSKDNRYFVAEYNSKGMLSFKEVEGISDSTKTLRIELTTSNATGTMLKVFNPFAEMLVYKAEMYSYKKKDYLVTSTVPVYPKISSFETWPFNIDQLRLTGFKLIKTE